VTTRPGPRDLRASDADRELVLGLLGEAVADGRLTLAEHAERSELALSARTIGELASLTNDLATLSGQPIKLYSRSTVTALCGRERREGRWVVPEVSYATAIFGDVVLDLRDAVLPSQRVIIYATAVGGQVRLIVPAGVAVQMTGRSFLGIRSIRNARGGPLARTPGEPAPGSSVIEVRTIAIGGLVKAVTPRRPRWRGRRVGEGPRGLWP
jgi:hypothetical protein